MKVIIKNMEAILCRQQNIIYPSLCVDTSGSELATYQPYHNLDISEFLNNSSNDTDQKGNNT